MQSKTILVIACFTALHTLVQAQDKSTEKDVLTIYKGAHSYKEVSVAGKTTEVYVDDKRVSDNEAPHYDSLIQVMRTDVDGDGRDRTWEDRQGARDQEQAERDQERAERDQQRAERQQEEQERNQERAERAQEQAENRQQQTERQHEQAERDRERAQEQRERAQERDQEQRERDAAQRERDQAQADQERIQARSERAQAENEREQAKLDRIQARFDREQAKEERAMFHNLIQFLLDQHIVADRDHLSSLVLTDTSLYVNGVKQPQDIHRTLKEQYGQWAQRGLSYGDSQAPGTSMFFSRPYYSDCCQ